jgi:hypothetical protein
MCIGVAFDDMEWNEDPLNHDWENGAGMCLDEGSLFGYGKVGSNQASRVAEGQVAVTMELDTDAHTLKFWVDGKPHGEGFTTGVAGSLRWALSIGSVSVQRKLF